MGILFNPVQVLSPVMTPPDGVPALKKFTVLGSFFFLLPSLFFSVGLLLTAASIPGLWQERASREPTGEPVEPRQAGPRHREASQAKRVVLKSL